MTNISIETRLKKLERNCENIGLTGVYSFMQSAKTLLEKTNRINNQNTTWIKTLFFSKKELHIQKYASICGLLFEFKSLISSGSALIEDARKSTQSIIDELSEIDRSNISGTSELMTTYLQQLFQEIFSQSQSHLVLLQTAHKMVISLQKVANAIEANENMSIVINEQLSNIKELT